MPLPAVRPDLADLAQEVMARCDALALCSEEPGRLTRRFLSPAMHEAHQRVAGWLQDAGLETRVDNAGNLFGKRTSSGARRTLLVGSHLDTVPNAGRYDGALGVLLGVAVAHALRDQPLPFHLEVVGFSEEEGVRFLLPYLGSSAVAGAFRPEWLGRVDLGGATMGEALAAFGLSPPEIPLAAYAAGSVLGFIEPHLEQGPVLEAAGRPVAVVSAIAGQSRVRVEFQGRADHAGTTPLEMRQDALVPAAALVSETRRIAAATAGLRATVGRLEVTPNAPNVVAARAEVSLDVRHADDATREEAVSQLLSFAEQAAAREGARCAVLEHHASPSAVMDPVLTAELERSLPDLGPAPRLLSGAGHDAVVMSRKFPTAMLFLRHPGGVSHHPDERVETADVAVAIDVLCRFIQSLAEKEGIPQ